MLFQIGYKYSNIFGKKTQGRKEKIITWSVSRKHMK